MNKNKNEEIIKKIYIKNLTDEEKQKYKDYRREYYENIMQQKC